MTTTATKKILVTFTVFTCFLIGIIAYVCIGTCGNIWNDNSKNSNIPNSSRMPLSSETNTILTYKLPELPINNELTKKLQEKPQKFSSNNQPEKNSIYLGYFDGLPLLYHYSKWRDGDGEIDLYSGRIATSIGGLLDNVDFRKIDEPRIIYQDNELSGIGGFKFSKNKKSIFITISHKANRNYPYGYSQIIKTDLETKSKNVIWPVKNAKLSIDPILLMENFEDKYLLFSTTQCSYGEGVECDPYKISGKQIFLNLVSHQYIELPGSYGEIKVYLDSQKFSYKQQEYQKVFIGKACFDRCTSSGCTIDSDLYECHAGGYGNIWISIGNEIFDPLP
ncbi:MAG: hypothetical protein M3Q44_04120 [bacterium]|nr:hypothetical protein [bacterium]